MKAKKFRKKLKDQQRQIDDLHKFSVWTPPTTPVRTHSGGVLPDGTTNTPPIDFDQMTTPAGSETKRPWPAEKRSRLVDPEIEKGTISGHLPDNLPFEADS